ncbi:MAG TPA: polymer-forming cytoskeletal protein [Spirochaetia bacterium]|nr:polymer-forming cytoskeletal protein [Spirochaetia bacterium]
MAEVRIKEIDEHEIDTILAEDIEFEGYLTFKKPLMIKGKFKGEIKSTSALYIGEKAYVEASTEAGIVSSKGRHKGDIVARSRVELYSTAQVDGDISTPDLVVESGCRFNGLCNMGGTPAVDGKGEQKPTPATQPAAGAAPAAPSGQAAPAAGQAPAQPQAPAQAQGPAPAGHSGPSPQPGQQNQPGGQRPGVPGAGGTGQQR